MHEYRVLADDRYQEQLQSRARELAASLDLHEATQAEIAEDQASGRFLAHPLDLEEFSSLGIEQPEDPRDEQLRLMQEALHNATRQLDKAQDEVAELKAQAKHARGLAEFEATNEWANQMVGEMLNNLEDPSQSAAELAQMFTDLVAEEIRLDKEDVIALLDMAFDCVGQQPGIDAHTAREKTRGSNNHLTHVSPCSVFCFTAQVNRRCWGSWRSS